MWSTCVSALAKTSKHITETFRHNPLAHGTFFRKFARGEYIKQFREGQKEGKLIYQSDSFLKLVSHWTRFIPQRPNAHVATWHLLKKPDPKACFGAFHPSPEAEGRLEAGWNTNQERREGGSWEKQDAYTYTKTKQTIKSNKNKLICSSIQKKHWVWCNT